MTPRQIALLLTENIRSNNGLVLEAVAPVFTDIAITNIEDQSQFPFLVKTPAAPGPELTPIGIVLPTNRAGINHNIDKIYFILRSLILDFSDDKQIKCSGVLGNYYKNSRNPNKKVTDYNPVDLSQQGNAELVQVAQVFSYVKAGGTIRMTIQELIKLSKQYEARPNGTYALSNEGDWARKWEIAVKSVGRQLIVDQNDMPKAVFPKGSYFALENNGMVMLASGVYGEGLYVFNGQIEINGQAMPWQEAVDQFAQEKIADRNLRVQQGEVITARDERIRLLWRDFIKETGQGYFIERAELDPTETIESFQRAENLQAFQDSYRAAVITTESILEKFSDLITEINSRLDTTL